MSTIAEKLNYLNDTKGLFKNRINSLGGEITEQTTFRNYITWLDKFYNEVSDETDMAKNGIVGDTEQDGEPSPDFPQEIKNRSGDLSYKVTGKNLFDVDNLNSSFGYYRDNGVYNTNAKFAMTFDYIKVISNINYTLSVNKNIRALVINEFDIDKNFIKRNLVNDTNICSITTSSTTKYIKLTFNKDDSTELSVDIVKEYNAQLEQNDHATEYEPYISRTFPVNLKSKNLFDKDNAINGKEIRNTQTGEIGNNENWFITNYIKIEPNTVYTVSGKQNGNAILYYDSNKNFTSGISTGGTGTFTTPNNVSYIVLNGLLSEKDTFQLEKGSQATQYVDYFTPIELCKIGTYQDFIKRSTGKNLFDKDNATTQIGYFKADGGIGSGGNSTITSSYTKIIPNLTYTLSGFILENVAFYDENYTFIKRVSSINTNNYTFNENAFYIRIQGLTVNFDINTLQLELGDTATEYEPYGHQFYLHKNIYKDTYNGSESYWYSASQSISSYYKQVSYAKITGVNNFYCDKFSYKGNAQSTELGYAMSFNANSQYNRYMYIQVPSDVVGINDVEAFKTWLGTHNVSVQYPLATPTTEVISDENYPVLYKQLSDIQDYLTSYKINKEFILGYDEPSVEY
jgi:hypothetical protein